MIISNVTEAMRCTDTVWEAIKARRKPQKPPPPHPYRHRTAGTAGVAKTVVDPTETDNGGASLFTTAMPTSR